MSVQPRGGAWRRQDGQVLVIPQRRKPHVQQQWNWRCPDGWADYPVRVAWREGDPRDPRRPAVAERLHRETGMLLVSEFGFLQTAYPIWWDDWRDG